MATFRRVYRVLDGLYYSQRVAEILACRQFGPNVPPNKLNYDNFLFGNLVVPDPETVHETDAFTVDGEHGCYIPVMLRGGSSGISEVGRIYVDYIPTELTDGEKVAPCLIAPYDAENTLDFPDPSINILADCQICSPETEARLKIGTEVRSDITLSYLLE